jgi:sulfate transport system ATP-binding protein
MGIVVRNLCKKFGEFVAVDHVNFEVNAGELVALLGPSGSGKSTILRIIAGLDTPDSGEIYLTGADVTSVSTQKRGIGFVFQHYALFKHLNVAKNIAFGLEIQKSEKKYIKQKVNELIELVKLEGYEKHYPDQLSGGQRQRVALARALATEPKVLLLDEPFGALDAKVRDNLAQWLKEFHKNLKITSIFVTHDQAEAIEISDKIVVINHGKVEQVGDAQDVYEHPQSKFVASFIGQVNVIDATIRNGRIYVKNSDTMIEASEQHCGDNRDIVLLIRPEDIVIKGRKESPHDLPCRINRIHYQGSHFKIDCSLNQMNLRVIENKNLLIQENWHENQDVFLSLKLYRVFGAEEGHQKVRDKLKSLGYIE